MYYGKDFVTIDAKGRVRIPAKYKEQLGEKFIVSQSFDKCLMIYSEEEWESFTDRLKKLPMMNADTRKFTRFFLSGAEPLTVDKQGRILIPPSLRGFANLTKEVVFSAGTNGQLEIWDKNRFEEAMLESEEDVNDIASRLNDLGIEF
ncbi:MAG: division/cell wall cluster transcriptional repressor MraZ [Eubacterium sp.]